MTPSVRRPDPKWRKLYSYVTRQRDKAFAEFQPSGSVTLRHCVVAGRQFAFGDVLAEMDRLARPPRRPKKGKGSR